MRRTPVKVRHDKYGVLFICKDGRTLLPKEMALEYNKLAEDCKRLRSLWHGCRDSQYCDECPVDGICEKEPQGDVD